MAQGRRHLFKAHFSTLRTLFLPFIALFVWGCYKASEVPAPPAAVALFERSAADADIAGMQKAIDQGVVLEQGVGVSESACREGVINAIALDIAHEPSVAQKMRAIEWAIRKGALLGSPAAPLSRLRDPVMVRFILSKGADPNEFPNKASSALHSILWAPVQRDSPYSKPFKEVSECARLLLEAGANPNQPAGSALAMAAYEGDLTLTKLLIEKGADVNAIYEGSRHRMTALHRCALFDTPAHVAVAQELRDHGAKLDIREQGARRGQAPAVGVTPYELAIKKGNLKVAEALKS